MPFDLAKIQASDVEDYVKGAMYKNLHFAAQKSNWIRPVGLLVGIGSGLMTVGTRVAAIAETIFKGLIDVFGSICCVSKCSFGRGLGRLTFGLLGEGIYAPFSVLSAGLGLIGKTYNFAVNPEEYALERWMAHDKEGVADYLIHERNNNKEDLKLVKKLIKHFDNLDGDIHYDRQISLLKLAAQYGSVNAMCQVAIRNDNYKAKGSEVVRNNPAVALEFYEKAAAKGGVAPKFRLSLAFLRGELGIDAALPANQLRGLKLLREAAQKGHKGALCEVAVCMIEAKHGFTKDEVRGFAILNQVQDYAPAKQYLHTHTFQSGHADVSPQGLASALDAPV